MVDNRGPELTAVCATFAAAAFVTTALRVYVRTYLVKAFSYDDAFMLLALASHIMFAACAIGGVHYGTGRHMSTLTPDSILKALRYWWLCYVAYSISMVAAKISIGLFLLRVTVKPIHKWIIYTAMSLTALTGVVFLLVTLLQCSPINFFWDRTIEGGSCINIDVIIGLTFFYSIVSVICDFTFAILPIFLVWGLNMSVRTRLVLIPILGMACVASIAVLVRLGFIMDFKNPDFLYATLDIAIWSDIEQGLAITAGSLATLRPLFRLLSDRFGFLSTGNPSGPSKPSGRRTPQWNPNLETETGKKPGFLGLTSSLFRSEKVTMKTEEEEYGMGDLQPIRLKDDVREETPSEKSDQGYNTWRIHKGKPSDEECQAGTITKQTQVYHASEAR